MADLFGFLLLACIILIIIGSFKPEKALFWFKGIKDRKTVYKYYGIGILISFIGFGIFNPKKGKTKKDEIANEQPQKVENENKGSVTFNANGEEVKRNEIETIKYEVLREWQPDKENDAIGMDILIDKKYATKDKIIELIKQIVNEDVEKANILVFTTKNAWEEGQRGSGFTSDYKKSYIAFYVKNNSSDGAYSGFNEIRWMQEIGELSNLYGTNTEL